MSEISQGARKIISVDEVLEQVPFSKATLYREIKAGRFAQPIEISARRVGFFQDEIAANLAARAAKRKSSAV